MKALEVAKLNQMCFIIIFVNTERTFDLSLRSMASLEMVLLCYLKDKFK